MSLRFATMCRQQERERQVHKDEKFYEEIFL